MRLTTPAFFGAYQKGRKAARDGLPKDACPYDDKRGGAHGHIITYSRSFIGFWCDGWDDETSRKPDRYGKKPPEKALRASGREQRSLDGDLNNTLAERAADNS